MATDDGINTTAAFGVEQIAWRDILGCQLNYHGTVLSCSDGRQLLAAKASGQFRGGGGARTASALIDDADADPVVGGGCLRRPPPGGVVVVRLRCRIGFVVG